MTILKILLNIPWSFVMYVAALVSLPHHLQFGKWCVIITVRSFWWYPARGVRAMTLGNVILLGPRVERGDLDHELVHIEQSMRETFIHPFLSCYQLLKYGSRDSVYEQEAYRKAGNRYRS